MIGAFGWLCMHLVPLANTARTLTYTNTTDMPHLATWRIFSPKICFALNIRRMRRSVRVLRCARRICHIYSSPDHDTVTLSQFTQNVKSCFPPGLNIEICFCLPRHSILSKMTKVRVKFTCRFVIIPE